MPFNYDLGQHHEQLSRDGFVLLKNVLSDRLMTALRRFLLQSRKGEIAEFGKWRIGGKKHQYLFDFPDDRMALEFRDGIAALTGMKADAITISERHLKQYEETAPDYPAPHKDRNASTYSIGLPVHLGEGSTVCVFPTLDRGPNQADRAVFMTAQDHPGLEDIYNSPDAVMLNEELGDMIVFEGSTIYHERVRARGTAVLYVKINDVGADPLGENIFAGMAAATA